MQIHRSPANLCQNCMAQWTFCDHVCMVSTSRHPTQALSTSSISNTIDLLVFLRHCTDLSSRYWPKDQPNAGNVAGGHRHEWESTVVWLDNPENATPALIGAAASGHGGYKTSTDPSRNGDRVKVEYYTEFPRNHELQFSSTEGWGFWKIHWDNLPGPARQALQDTDFGSANVPFKDGNFESNLDKAWV